MDFPADLNRLLFKGAKSDAGTLLALNAQLQHHGLALTPADAQEIVAARGRSLRALGRVELDLHVTQALTAGLAGSAYVTRDNFVQTINELYEIFHAVKNATSDRVADDELLDAVLFCFEKVCGGSSALVAGKGMEMIIENFREHRPLQTEETNEEEEAYWHFDE